MINKLLSDDGVKGITEANGKENKDNVEIENLKFVIENEPVYEPVQVGTVRAGYFICSDGTRFGEYDKEEAEERQMRLNAKERFDKFNPKRIPDMNDQLYLPALFGGEGFVVKLNSDKDMLDLMMYLEYKEECVGIAGLFGGKDESKVVKGRQDSIDNWEYTFPGEYVVCPPSNEVNDYTIYEAGYIRRRIASLAALFSSDIE